jgi:hypothetical protein
MDSDSFDSDTRDKNIPEGLIITPGKCLPDAKDRYEYPVRPGMQEWDNLSYEEKNKLSQIPDETLKTLSTYALIQGLMEKPLLELNVLLSSDTSPIRTFYRSFSSINAVSELENRQDIVEALTGYYEAVSFDCSLTHISNALPLRPNSFTTQLEVLEILFTRDKILRQMNSVQKKHAVSLLLDKYKQETKILGYGQCAVTVMAWIMIDDNYSSFMTFYKNKGLDKYIIDGNYMDDVVSFAKKYTH